MYLKKAVSNLSLINIIIFLETAFSFEKKKLYSSAETLT